MSKPKIWESLTTLFKKSPPSSPEDELEAAAAYQAANQPEAAAETYLKILSHYPDQSWWYNISLWESLEQTERLDRAIAILGQANQPSNSVHPITALNLAEALTRQGDYPAAMTHYQSASYAKFSKSYQQLVETAWTKTPLSPQFIIIGAAKSGTSALYSYLASHPNVLPAVVKEINFWSYRFQNGLPWYQSHFPAISETIALQQGLVTGEASPSYFAHPEAPQRLKQAYPNIRLIVSLRNPVERTISHYYDRVRRHQEVRPLAQAIDDSLSGNFNHPAEVKLAHNYLQQSCYSDNLKAWYSHFDSRQIYVIKSEDLLDQPATTSQLSQYRKYNVGNYNSSISKLDRESEDKVKAQLRDYFQEDTKQLQNIIGTVLTW
ncbi:MAG: sulfotransferase domain-containing protein [Phormidium sp. BM_Day4_Bin.17]|nr:sulfotransferase domain-containing protein [Phormidium sp. BM_Day4_Bin.17]UCJ11214.1 MAG: sulfotransferase domain-containing protein [Phormidium sp. PBR-2020]